MKENWAITISLNKNYMSYNTANIVRPPSAGSTVDFGLNL